MTFDDGQLPGLTLERLCLAGGAGYGSSAKAVVDAATAAKFVAL
jgi:hypothetical protein